MEVPNPGELELCRGLMLVRLLAVRIAGALGAGRQCRGRSAQLSRGYETAKRIRPAVIRSKSRVRRTGVD